jgi:hypothetical protein
MQFVLLGDTAVGQEALLRFYVLHAAVLPAVLVLLIAIHFWRIRKDGGLSRPEEAKAEPKAETAVVKMTIQPAKKKVYGLQGFVRGPFTKVGNVPDDSVYAWPNLPNWKSTRAPKKASTCTISGGRAKSSSKTAS